MSESKLVDLDFCVAKFKQGFFLEFLSPSCTDENGFTPAQSIAIYNPENIKKLFLFLSEVVKEIDKTGEKF